MKTFGYTANPARVILGAGTIRELRAEVEKLGRRRVLLVSDPGLADAVDRAAANLGDLAVARFDGVAMHTPVAVTVQALELVRAHDVDCLVSIGGGSATGLGKALAVRAGLPQIAIPSTYAGSEVTPVLGETDQGRKMTRSAPEILPRTVIYDVELTVGLPVAASVTSGFNAIAHAVEALYSPQANPVVDELAVQAITRLARGLAAVVADPTDLEARTDTLIGAWLAGMCLGAVGMGLHHKLCHTLGGSFDLNHAAVHTILLPHVMAYNAPAAPDAMRRVGSALGRGDDAPGAMFDLVTALGGPTALRDLGLTADDLSQVAKLATSTPYPNPREVTADGVLGLLQDAWSGARPPSAHPTTSVPNFSWLTDQVVASFAGTPDPRLRRLIVDLVRHLHTFAETNDLTQEEWQVAIDFLTRTGQLSSATRQEFVLLSDTLGVSSMVDLLTNSRTPDTTPSAVLGPFYQFGPPAVDQGGDIAGDLPGTPLWVDVEVVDLAGAPVADAVVDVWQSNQDGFYDLQLPELDGPVLRARFTSDADGRVRFWSILPSEYPIPDDGPVGQLLAATGRHPWRAPHLHFLINAAGHRQLITQLFVAGGAYLDSDTVFGVKDELIVDYTPGQGTPPTGRSVDGEWRLLTYTFRIA